MERLNLICAYRALQNTDIDKCNGVLRNFLIENCVFLPKEIPEVIKELGIGDMIEGFKDCDFEKPLEKLNCKEFELFRAFNSPNTEEQITNCGVDMKTLTSERKEDNRFEVAKEKLHERALKIVRRYV